MIKLANEKDIYGIYGIIKDAKKLLKDSGSNQWQDTDGYPSMETITNLVNRREMYVNIRENEIVGCVALCKGIEEAYNNIEGKWLNDRPYYTLHILATKNGHYNRGVASELIEEMIKIAYKEEIYNIKVDTKVENKAMDSLLLKLGFHKTGIITLLRDGVIDPKRVAYQLVITPEMFESKTEVIPSEKKESVFKKILNYVVKTTNGMAHGLFATLIIGVIITQFGELFNLEFLKTTGTVLKGLMAVGIGVGVASTLKLSPIALISSGAASAIAASINGNNNPLVCYVASVAAIEITRLILRKKTPVDILLIPLMMALISFGVGFVVEMPLTWVMDSLAEFINYATSVQPLLMGIIISVVMGMCLTAPISSAAIAIAIGLGGIPAGAAVVGCSVQMIGFAVMSAYDNNIGKVISVGIGTSMLQFKNILKKPIIWLPTIIVSAILGPISTMVFKMECNSVGAGMGTCGLVGQMGTIASMTDNPFMCYLGIALLHFVLPAVLVFVVNLIFRKTKLIKPGDLTI